MQTKTFRKYVEKHIRKIKANNEYMRNTELKRIVNTQGYLTAIIKTRWGFILMQTKTVTPKLIKVSRNKAINEIWITNSEVNMLIDKTAWEIYPYFPAT